MDTFVAEPVQPLMAALTMALLKSPAFANHNAPQLHDALSRMPSLESEPCPSKKLRLDQPASITLHSPNDHTSSSSSTCTSMSAQHSPVLDLQKTRKAPSSTAVKDKDDAYRNRRLKNNAAAKMSREKKRLKEKQTAELAERLERENMTLRQRIFQLNTEIAQLKLVRLNGQLSEPDQLPNALLALLNGSSLADLLCNDSLVKSERLSLSSSDV